MNDKCHGFCLKFYQNNLLLMLSLIKRLFELIETSFYLTDWNSDEFVLIFNASLKYKEGKERNYLIVYWWGPIEE